MFNIQRVLKVCLHNWISYIHDSKTIGGPPSRKKSSATYKGGQSVRLSNKAGLKSPADSAERKIVIPGGNVSSAIRNDTFVT
jgi:hypothetical protein